ncbi:hypothetical protein THRCLA_22812 [Thraustotheca clavata]|uniref:SWIM-type domain-containing protein n=1 Tax=Thraustotheca clavata TaxID=74557 RepID=A0A1V9YSH6_9STRA|nr:hypothetical protein THRCLA_22812 [Thraustotheca clavata]
MSNEVSAAILRRVFDDVKSHGGTFGPEHAEVMMAMNHSEADMLLLQAAVELVEKHRVTKISAEPSGRTLIRVASPSRGGVNAMYICLDHFCSCDSFLDNTVQNPFTMCKHMLAAMIAQATMKLQVLTVPDSEFANLLCPEDTPSNM